MGSHPTSRSYDEQVDEFVESGILLFFKWGSRNRILDYFFKVATDYFDMFPDKVLL